MIWILPLRTRIRALDSLFERWTPQIPHGKHTNHMKYIWWAALQTLNSSIQNRGSIWFDVRDVFFRRSSNGGSTTPGSLGSKSRSSRGWIQLNTPHGSRGAHIVVVCEEKTWCILAHPLLGALGTRTLLGAPGLATRSKDATRSKGHRY